MYCNHCGKQNADNAKYCAACGTPIAEQQTASNETSGVWFAVLGLFVPVAGFVLFLVFQNKKPRWSKYAGIGALVGAIAKTVISIILVVIYFAFASTWMNTLFEQYSRGLGGAEGGVFGFTLPDEPDYKSSLESALDRLQDENSGLFKEESTEEILEKYADVSFGEFKAKKDNYLTTTSLDVTVKNKADTMYSYHITVEAVDKDGARLGTDMVFAQSLRSGQSVHLTAFQFVDRQKLEQFQKASFRVLKIDKYEY